MGLLDSLTGRTRLADFAITFDGRHVSVIMEPVSPSIHPSEFVRWCCAYHAQVLFNLGQGSPLALDLIQRVGEVAGSDDFPPATDCVAESGFPFDYSASIRSPTNEFRGTLYGKGPEHRWVQVKFPLRLVELQLGVSCFGVIQRAIELMESPVDRQHLGRALCLLAVLWATSDTSNPRAVAEIPMAAFSMALENQGGSDEVAMGDMRKCPYCAEMIKRGAVKCRYCQSDIEVQPARPASLEGPSDITLIKCHHCGSHVSKSTKHCESCSRGTWFKTGMLISEVLAIAGPAEGGNSRVRGQHSLSYHFATFEFIDDKLSSVTGPASESGKDV
jgi:hypothetical protein